MTTPELPDGIPHVLTPEQVSDLFNVDQRTVARWDNTGKVTAIRTPRGTRRYPSAQFIDTINATGWRP